MIETPGADTDVGKRRIAVSAADVVDVFVYVVVLNLAVQFLPAVIAETFTVSLLTALVLKVVLEAVLSVKTRMLSRLKAASTVRGRVTAALLLWLVVFVSKFVVLALIDLLFGDQASLGGFWEVALLIIALMLSRAGVRRLLAD